MRYEIYETIRKDDSEYRQMERCGMSLLYMISKGDFTSNFFSQHDRTRGGIRIYDKISSVKPEKKDSLKTVIDEPRTRFQFSATRNLKCSNYAHGSSKQM